MLRYLRVTNLALIDDLELEFAPGMNVVTGETGAGKSLLMQGLGLVLGSRGRAGLVRKDSGEAQVKAIFSADGESGQDFLKDNDLLEGQELTIQRSVTETGRNRVYLNGVPRTVSTLRQVSKGLIQIFGQHEHHALRDPNTALYLLDDFLEMPEQLVKMADAYGTLAVGWKNYTKLTTGREEAEKRADFLKFQLDEIRRAALQSGEEEALRQEREVLSNAQKILSVVCEGENVLASGEGAVTDLVAQLESRVSQMAQIDNSLKNAAGILQDSLAQLEEVALLFRKYAQKGMVNPDRLEEVEQRVSLIKGLKKKYGADVDAVLQRADVLEKELQETMVGDDTIEAARQAVDVLAETAWRHAGMLSTHRLKAAEKLERSIQDELGLLGMQGARFDIRFAQHTKGEDGGDLLSPLWRAGRQIHDRGFDEIEFYLSANVGEPLLPLVEVASGGELSRLMLAVKALNAAAEKTPTMIFDEVDTGIGGAVAEVVARRLKALATDHQIICVTHLPQIAAFADYAYLVTKITKDGRTMSSAKRLTRSERERELARMVGGVKITTEARKLAKEMLGGARRKS